jgi:hypothetical protein
MSINDQTAVDLPTPEYGLGCKKIEAAILASRMFKTEYKGTVIILKGDFDEETPHPVETIHVVSILRWELGSVSFAKLTSVSQSSTCSAGALCELRQDIRTCSCDYVLGDRSTDVDRFN